MFIWCSRSGYMGLKDIVVNQRKTNLLFPSAQIYGRIIANIATSAIDISDGIIQDLSHLISCSGVGCNLDLDQVPVVDKQYKKQCLEFGDDYELLFTVPPKKLLALQARLNSCKKKCHTIGVMSGKKLILTNKQGSMNNWDHFK